VTSLPPTAEFEEPPPPPQALTKIITIMSDIRLTVGDEKFIEHLPGSFGFILGTGFRPVGKPIVQGGSFPF
jgi:hypothetical protein